MMAEHDDKVPQKTGWDSQPQTFVEITAQRLARLNAASTWPDNIGGGGVPETSSAELAMALAYAHPSVHQLIVAKYILVNGERAQAAAFYPTWDLIMEMKRTDRWPDGPKGKHWYRNLTTMAILELTEPELCVSCEGRGIRSENGRQCASCSGTGKRVLGDVERAEALQIPFKDWKGGWRDRYEKIYRRLTALEQLSLAAIGRQLRRVPA